MDSNCRSLSSLRIKKQEQKCRSDLDSIKKSGKQIYQEGGIYGFEQYLQIENKPNKCSIVQKERNQTTLSIKSKRAIVDKNSLKNDSIPFLEDIYMNKEIKKKDELTVQDSSQISPFINQQLLLKSIDINESIRETNPPNMSSVHVREVIARSSKKRNLLSKQRDTLEIIDQYQTIDEKEKQSILPLPPLSPPIASNNYNNKEFKFSINHENSINHQVQLKEINCKEKINILFDSLQIKQKRASSNTINKYSPTRKFLHKKQLRSAYVQNKQPLSLPRIGQQLNKQMENSNTSQITIEIENTSQSIQKRYSQLLIEEKRLSSIIHDSRTNQSCDQIEDTFLSQSQIEEKSTKQRQKISKNQNLNNALSIKIDEDKRKLESTIDNLTVQKSFPLRQESSIKKKLVQLNKLSSVAVHEKMSKYIEKLNPILIIKSSQDQPIMENLQEQNSDLNQQSSSSFFKLQQYYSNKYESLQPNYKRREASPFMNKKKVGNSYENNFNNNNRSQQNISEERLATEQNILLDLVSYQNKCSNQGFYDDLLSDLNISPLESKTNQIPSFIQEEQYSVLKSSSNNQIINSVPSNSCIFPFQMTSKQVELMQKMKTKREGTDLKPWDNFVHVKSNSFFQQEDS